MRDMGICKPGDYQCHPSNYAWLLVCDAKGNWQAFSYCGMNGPYGCCRGTSWPGPDHSCDCRPPGSGLLASNTIEESAVTLAGLPQGEDNVATTTSNVDKRSSADLESTAQQCTPGQYWCDQNNFDWIIVCDQAGKWQKSSYCGMTGELFGW
jgi:hypothetical protein